MIAICMEIENEIQLPEWMKLIREDILKDLKKRGML